MKPATFLLTALLAATAQAAPPVISNVTASQRAGTKLVDIRYDVADPDSASLTIQIELSANGGQTYELPAKSLTGAVGPGVAPGTARLITWNAGTDWNGNWSPNCKARLWAHDGSTPVPPLGMVYIPAGTFDMGSGPGVIGVPVTLTKSYFMDRTEVSAELWNEVKSWGLGHGYTGISGGSFRAPGHPIQTVDWFSCALWCNARSEKNGLTPCYYKDDERTDVLRSVSSSLPKNRVNWQANGYRLPSEAEWERAARGGLYRKKFPWGDVVDGSVANFFQSGDPFEETLASVEAGTTPASYFDSNQSPAGINMANGYGLMDMAGNVAEWCWPSPAISDGIDPISANWFTSSYPYTPYSIVNFSAVHRGGSWRSGAPEINCSDSQGAEISWYYTGPFFGLRISNLNIGFRCARSL